MAAGGGGPAAGAVLAEQELHLDCGGPWSRRGEAGHRRPGAEVFPRRRTRAALRQAQGDARARPAHDVHGPPDRAEVHPRRAVGAVVPRAARRAPAGHTLSLQLGRHLPVLGHRAKADRADRARLPAAPAVRAARHRGRGVERESARHLRGRLGAVFENGGHREVRPARFAKGPVERKAARTPNTLKLPGTPADAAAKPR